MTNFTSIINYQDKYETLIEEGFENALVVVVGSHWDHDALNGPWGIEWKKVIEPPDVQEAYGLAKQDVQVPFSNSYYWLVRRCNGTMYPWPLLFCSQEEREDSARRYTDETWRRFYEGTYTSEQLDQGLVDCPSEAEVDELLTQVEAFIAQGESLWDDLDQRGGLVPRWAA